MDCWPYIFALFSNQYWTFFYPSTVLPLLPLAKREVTCHGWPSYNHDIKEMHVTGVICTSTQTTQHSGC